MSEELNESDTIEFSCSHCGGKIAVPGDLPPTSGPCPYCGETVTSPGMESDTQVEAEPAKISDQAEQPKPAGKPEPVKGAIDKLEGSKDKVKPAAKPLPVEDPIVKEREDSSASVAPTRRIPAPKKAQDERHSNPVLLSVVVIGVLLLGWVAWFATQYKPSREQARMIDFNETEVDDDGVEAGLPDVPFDWQLEAKEVLERFIGAQTIEEKAAVSIPRDGLEGDMQAFYAGREIGDNDLKIEGFLPRPVLPSDQERGIFMMSYDPEPYQVFALFKRGENGLRVDWDTFVQTKHRLLKEFVEHPDAGKTGVFRVVIMRDANPVKDGFEYFVADPSRTSEDHAWARAAADAGMPELGEDSETATVELGWSDGDKPQLEIRQFICWEFLGVGGKLSRVRE